MLAPVLSVPVAVNVTSLVPVGMVTDPTKRLAFALTVIGIANVRPGVLIVIRSLPLPVLIVSDTVGIGKEWLSIVCPLVAQMVPEREQRMRLPALAESAS